MKEYEPEIAKVSRQNHRGIQRLKARELVPGDVVDVSGMTWQSKVTATYTYQLPLIDPRDGIVL